MQAADLGDSHDATERRRLNAPRHRCIPLQGEMRPGRVVVEDVLLEDLPKVVGLPPIQWTLSERRIGFPTGEQELQEDEHGGGSLPSSSRA